MNKSAIKRFEKLIEQVENQIEEATIAMCESETEDSSIYCKIREELIEARDSISIAMDYIGELT